MPSPSGAGCTVGATAPRLQPSAVPLQAGQQILLDVDYQGRSQARRPLSVEARLVFILPPSFAVLAERLRGRGTDAASIVEQRLQKAREELRQFRQYHYLVMNGDVDRAFAEPDAIFLVEQARVCAQLTSLPLPVQELALSCRLEARTPLAEQVLASAERKRCCRRYRQLARSTSRKTSSTTTTTKYTLAISSLAASDVPGCRFDELAPAATGGTVITRRTAALLSAGRDTGWTPGDERDEGATTLTPSCVTGGRLMRSALGTRTTGAVIAAATADGSCNAGSSSGRVHCTSSGLSSAACKAIAISPALRKRCSRSRHRAQHHRLDRQRDVGIAAAQRFGIGGHDQRQHGQVGVRGLRRDERRPTGEQLIQHGADAVDVDALIDVAALSLLGRHVHQRAQRLPSIRHRVALEPRPPKSTTLMRSTCCLPSCTVASTMLSGLMSRWMTPACARLPALTAPASSSRSLRATAGCRGPSESSTATDLPEIPSPGTASHRAHARSRRSARCWGGSGAPSRSFALKAPMRSARSAFISPAIGTRTLTAARFCGRRRGGRQRPRPCPRGRSAHRCTTASPTS